MKHGLLVLLLSIPPACTSMAGSLNPDPADTLGVIDTVLVFGNEKTKDYVILDEMTLRPGSAVTIERLNYDRARIYSLGLFTSVDLFYDSLSTAHTLIVSVRERWYLIPFPIFGFRYGDPRKVFFGAGVLHNNLGGVNKKIYGAVAFGYDPSLSLSYVDPLLDAGSRLYASGHLSYSRALNKSEKEAALSGEFFEYHVNVSPTLGKRLSLYENASISLGYQYVHVSSYREGRTVSTEGRDQYLYAEMGYRYDSRDLGEYASRGLSIGLGITKNGFGESSVNWARYSADLRGYLPLGGNFTLAGRIFGTIVSGGSVPTYGHAYFGYGERLRGHFRTTYEGENQLHPTVELRYGLLPARTIQAPWVPLPQEFTVWRFGIALAGFADAGTVWDRGETLSVNSFHSGYGAGIHFLLPYGFVVRTEYAWDEYGRGEFILDFSTSF